MATTPVSGYTNFNLDGLQTNQTAVLTAQTLAGGNVTLTNDQMVNGRIEVTTGHATNVFIVPVTDYAGKIIIVANNDAALAAGIKVAGGTAITVAATKTAIVQVNGAGTEVKRVTLDA